MHPDHGKLLHIRFDSLSIFLGTAVDSHEADSHASPLDIQLAKPKLVDQAQVPDKSRPHAFLPAKLFEELQDLYAGSYVHFILGKPALDQASGCVSGKRERRECGEYKVSRIKYQPSPVWFD